MSQQAAKPVDYRSCTLRQIGALRVAVVDGSGTSSRTEALGVYIDLDTAAALCVLRCSAAAVSLHLAA